MFVSGQGNVAGCSNTLDPGIIDPRKNHACQVINSTQESPTGISGRIVGLISKDSL